MLRQIFGRLKTGSKKASGFRYDALDLLRADHMRIEALAIGLRLNRSARQKHELLGRLSQDLAKHMRIEEEIFYPACSRIAGLAKIIDHAHADHQLVKNVIKDLAVLKPESDHFNSLLTKLIIKLEKHVYAEENTVFAGVRKGMSRSEFKTLNQEMVRAFAETRPMTEKAA
jgi:iron-sulfur cluster repair protein YtfE (RIC family)